MQKHSLGPRSPVKRDGEAQPECEGGTQQGKLKSKQQIKKRGGGGRKRTLVVKAQSGAFVLTAKTHNFFIATCKLKLFSFLFYPTIPGTGR